MCSTSISSISRPLSVRHPMLDHRSIIGHREQVRMRRHLVPLCRKDHRRFPRHPPLFRRYRLRHSNRLRPWLRPPLSIGALLRLAAPCWRVQRRAFSESTLLYSSARLRLFCVICATKCARQTRLMSAPSAATRFIRAACRWPRQSAQARQRRATPPWPLCQKSPSIAGFARSI